MSNESSVVSGLQLIKFTFVVTLIAFVMGFGVVKVLDKRTELLEAHDKYIKAQSEASMLKKEEKELEAAVEKWKEVKQFLWYSAEDGITIKDFEDAALKNGVKLLSIEPQPAVEKFYKNHLRAVIIKAAFYGDFPSVFDTITEIENLVTPGEIRQIKIEVLQEQTGIGNIEAEVEIVLYSLNPPEIHRKIEGESGRFDPFFPLILPEPPEQEEPVQSNPPPDSSVQTNPSPDSSANSEVQPGQVDSVMK
jgi:Tfp pilus assembly protein PilO